LTSPSHGVTRVSPDRPPADLADLVALVRIEGRPPIYRSFTAAEAGEAVRYAETEFGTVITLPLPYPERFAEASSVEPT
jgi:hypothetical protein